MSTSISQRAKKPAPDVRDRPIVGTPEEMATEIHHLRAYARQLERKLTRHVQRQRSEEEHNLFFACLPVALHNWPESYPVQFSAPDERTRCEDLRAWLMFELDHVEWHDIDLRPFADIPQERAEQIVSVAVATAKAFFARDKQRYIKVVPMIEAVRLIAPRTMAKGEIGARTFREIAQRAYDLLESILGFDVPAVVKARKHEAA